MSTQVAIVPDREAEIRWRNWQARGAEGDRRTAKQMRGVMLLIAVGFFAWVTALFA